jgi:hypothetical protein
MIISACFYVDTLVLESMETAAFIVTGDFTLKNIGSG